MKPTDSSPFPVVSLELPNGYPAQLSLYIKQIVRTQDLNAWRNNPDGFDAWLKGCICDYVQNLKAVIRY